MDDARAREAYDAYWALIRDRRNPSIVPELLTLTRDLEEASAYFDSIPVNKITPDQEKLSTLIDALLCKE